MKKKVFSLVTILIIVMLSICAVACDGGREVRVITFEANGGATISAMTVKEGESASLPATSKEGYTFDGWYLSADFTGEKLPTFYTPVASVIFYAKWKPAAYIITFECNGGMAVPAAAVTAGGAVTLPETTKERFAFIGWYKNPSFSGEMCRTPYISASSEILYAALSVGLQKRTARKSFCFGTE